MVDQEAVEYIKASLASGKSIEEIYLELLKSGWTVKVIQENFEAINLAEAEEDTQRRTIRIVLLIGAILIGAGVFSFVAANWQEMSKPLKISIILFSMLLAYGAGWYLRELRDFYKTGGALYLLGSIIYGAGIFLVGQMFNVRSNWPDGFILWMLGAVAMAFAVESLTLFSLAIVVGTVALIGHPFGLFGVFRNYNPFLLTSSFLLLAAAIVAFFAGWKLRKSVRPEKQEYY